MGRILEQHPDIKIVSADKIPANVEHQNRVRCINTQKHISDDPETYEFWETKIYIYHHQKSSNITASISIPTAIVKFLNLKHLDSIYIAIKKKEVKKEMSEIKYKIVDAEEIPERVRVHCSIWDKVFAEIPKGKAIVIPDTEAKPQSISSALRHRQRNGRFLNLCATSRKDGEGKRATYVVYPIERVDEYKQKHGIISTVAK